MLRTVQATTRDAAVRKTIRLTEKRRSDQRTSAVMAVSQMRVVRLTLALDQAKKAADIYFDAVQDDMNRLATDKRIALIGSWRIVEPVARSLEDSILDRFFSELNFLLRDDPILAVSAIYLEAKTLFSRLRVQKAKQRFRDAESKAEQNKDFWMLSLLYRDRFLTNVDVFYAHNFLDWVADADHAAAQLIDNSCSEAVRRDFANVIRQFSTVVGNAPIRNLRECIDSFSQALWNDQPFEVALFALWRLSVDCTVPSGALADIENHLRLHKTILSRPEL
jgi:hypothetical protein